jgi:hypothetical protein
MVSPMGSEYVLIEGEVVWLSISEQSCLYDIQVSFGPEDKGCGFIELMTNGSPDKACAVAVALLQAVSYQFPNKVHEAVQRFLRENPEVAR